MNFIEELKWRGMYHQATPGIEEHLNSGIKKGYIGFDPTAASLGIGNYVQIMILKLFQLSGHQPIVLLGGATGRIGDPSGKSKERELKSIQEIEKNLDSFKQQFEKFLEFGSGPTQAQFSNNLDIYNQMPVLDFLRDIGKHITINYMMSKDSVKNRIEGEGMSFTEFSYQLIQGYDFAWLYQHKGVTLQMGGSDQWGNITSGTHLIGKMLSDAKSYAVTTPLLTKSDGSKFGKSEGGNIWLDPNMTSPYKFYQFWLNTDDADLFKYLRYFSLKPRQEIIALENDLAQDPQTLKKILAEELTVRIHSKQDFDNVLKVTELLFSKSANNEFLRSLQLQVLDAIASEIPTFEIKLSNLQTQLTITEFMSDHTGLTNSRAEARRAIQGNSVSINKERISNPDLLISTKQLLHDKYILVENGKKNKLIVRIVA